MARHFDGTDDRVSNSNGISGLNVPNTTFFIWIKHLVFGSAKVLVTDAFNLGAGGSARTLDTAASVTAWEYDVRTSGTSGSWHFGTLVLNLFVQKI